MHWPLKVITFNNIIVIIISITNPYYTFSTTANNSCGFSFSNRITFISGIFSNVPFTTDIFYRLSITAYVSYDVFFTTDHNNSYSVPSTAYSIICPFTTDIFYRLSITAYVSYDVFFTTDHNNSYSVPSTAYSIICPFSTDISNTKSQYSISLSTISLSQNPPSFASISYARLWQC